MNQDAKQSKSPLAKILIVLLFLVAIPLAAPIVGLALICWCLVSVTIALLVSVLWVPRGIRFLVIYSDSAQWKTYFEGEVVPSLGGAARIINLSREGGQKKRWHLDWLIYRHCAGYQNRFPIVIGFSPFGIWKTIRFYDAYMQSKNGKLAALDKAKADLSLWLSDCHR